MNETNRKLLILDLDETLVYSETTPLDRNEDFKVNRYYVYKRPSLDKFLKFSFRNYLVSVWTSSSSDYANLIVQNIFTDPSKLKFVWSRERCTQRYNFNWRNYYWIKNLKKVKRIGFDLNSVIMIDDSPKKLERNYGNNLMVSPYYGAIDDNELEFLEKYLLTLKNVSNVREIEKRGWKASIQS